MSAYRRNFDHRTWTNSYEPTEEPEIKILSGNERVEFTNVKKKNLELLTKKERGQIEAALKTKDYMDTIPKEMIFCNEEDGSVIHNFEVEFEQEEELAMTGGLRGIKALRM